MIELFIIVLAYILTPIVFVYSFVLMFFFLISVLGIGFSFAFPIIAGLLILGMIIFIITFPTSETI